MVPKRYPNEWGRIALMGIVWLLALPLVPVAILVWACFYLLLNLKRMIFDRFAFAILTRGTIDDAWNRCIPFWRKRGGIDDWRGVCGRPSYWPSGAQRGWDGISPIVFMTIQNRCFKRRKTTMRSRLFAPSTSLKLWLAQI